MGWDWKLINDLPIFGGIRNGVDVDFGDFKREGFAVSGAAAIFEHSALRNREESVCATVQLDVGEVKVLYV